MKKILALALSLTMLLSAGIVQVSALGSNANYPYLFETYETEKSLEAITYEPSQAELSIASGGANGSGGSLQVLQKNKGFFDMRYSCEELLPEKGQEISMSVWIKLNSELLEEFNNKSCNVVSFIFHGNGTVTNVGNKTDISVGDEWTGTGWKQYDVTDLLVKDQWVQVTKDILWEDSMSIGSGATIGNIKLKTISLRVTGEAGTQALADPEATVLDYQVDDLVLEYPDEDRMGVNTTAGTYLVNDDFDSSSATGELEGRSDDCSPAYKETTTLSSTKGFGEQTYNTAYLQTGHLYKISGWFRYQIHPESTKEYTGRAQIRQITYAQNRDKADPNFFKSNYPSIYPAIIEGGKWTKVEYYYYLDFKAYDNHNIHVGFRICPENADYEANGVPQWQRDDPAADGIYGMDKIQILDLGMVGNGDMELDSSLLVYRNDAQVTQTFPGWVENNVTVERSTDTPSGEGASMKVTATKEYGAVQTTATLKQGKLYRISFKAKTEGLEPEETVPITMILDRQVSSGGTTEVYKVPNYQYMVGPEHFGNSAAVDGQEWTITNEWKEFSGWYSVDFPRIEGQEEADDTYVVPRRPDIYFRINNTNPEGSVLYLDDVKIEEMANSSILEDIKNGLDANVTDILTSGPAAPGSTISLSYTYAPKYSEEENKAATTIRAYTKLADGTERNYGLFSAEESFVVPACAAGEDITFEIIPVSTAGLIGNRASVTVDAATDYLVYDAASGKVTAGYSGAAAKIIYASYNGGALTSIAVSDAVFENGKFEETVPSSFTPGEGDTVKIIMWKDFVNFAPICAYAH